MSEVKYTKEQQSVIDSRGKNLLVSASAGSGKTTVMIERIISLMTSEPRVPISNFLVVTFTKASAADMKHKLASKLFELPVDDFVLEQIENIHTSDISNLHSFCSRLISTYFYKAQVDPNFHIVDEKESNILKERAFDELFEYKERHGDEAYFKLFEIFQKKRTDKPLREVVGKLNNFLNSILDSGNWLTKKINEAHNLDLNKNVCANIINGYVASEIEKDAKIANDFAKKANDLGEKKYADHFLEIANILLSVQKNKSFETNAKNIFEMRFSTTPRISNDLVELKQEAKFVKDLIKSHIENYKKNYVSKNSSELEKGLMFGREILIKLLNLTEEFGERYAKLKKDIGGLDFNDLEQYTLEILSDPVVLSDIHKRYKYVFVDEYQDINEVQEKIITLVSGENNRFMVGDIKQSIYRFRFCDPDIFLGTYKKYNESNENNEVIKLNCNFRSDKKILQFVDMVFSGVMTKDFGGVDYATESKFVAGENNLDLPNSVNLCLIDTEKEKQEKVPVSGVYSVKNHTEEVSEEDRRAECEAIYVAQKIAELVDVNNPNRIKYENIAILVQSRNETTAKFLQTLSKLGIPVSSDEQYDATKQNYIDEILCFVSLCVNQKDDIMLFKVLKSNLFGFSDNDLVKIRKLDMKSRFFDCLKNLDKLEDVELKQRLERFVLLLEKYKMLAKVLKIKDFVSRVVEEFSLKQICLSFADGTKRLSEIEEFEKTLPDEYPFEFVQSKDEFLLLMQNESGEDAVKFMSIHASKGIEFKVVFLCNTSKQFAMMSLSGDMLLSKTLGAGINYFNFETRRKNRTLALSAISLIEQRKLVEENQRLLYVALTRAREKLFVVVSKPKSEISKTIKDRKNCFANWFEPIIFDELNGSHNDLINFEMCVPNDLLMQEKQISHELLLSKKECEKPAQFEYDFKESCIVPLKNSVSKIIGQKQTSNEHEQAEFDDEIESFEKRKNNDFYAVAAERGTAYHKVFEKIDFKSDSGFDEQISKILSENLTAEELKLVDANAVKSVLDFPFFESLKNADKILKEREFFANVSAKLVNPKANHDDTFILQGVIDLLIVKNNELILLDYKTGNMSDEKFEKYKFQLDLYADVASRAFDLPVTKKIICFIDLKKLIEI